MPPLSVPDASLHFAPSRRSLVDQEQELPSDLDQLNRLLDGSPPQDILAWVWRTFGSKAAASSSFQTQSMPLLHMISQLMPDLEIFFLDTGYHFPETLAYREHVTSVLGINVRVLQTDRSAATPTGRAELYHADPDLCCHINKVEPLNVALADKAAWITGIRRDQTSTRSQAKIIDIDRDGIYKIAPMLNWTQSDVAAYIRENQLTEHPLTVKGYASVGCAPCTRPVGIAEDPRAGRWSDTDKTECGLHFDDNLPMGET